ncbi:tail tape measure protein [Haloarcula tailed virus 2]|uniref:Tail tape measure protein n=1 Tax=Haloarcula tailed virus 2 TaxID=2877989 RepID=A0AAE8XZV2_9CAUD|nr:tail tape measure protein [Haloarcula tailed virus 2]UBF23174.1 tail tape measure protein [Haloarcula tailed virus 2]
MVDVDTLQIVIDIVDEFSDEIRELKRMLIELRAVAEPLDNIVIDVDVRGEHEIDALMAKLAALQISEGLTDVGVDVGDFDGLIVGGGGPSGVGMGGRSGIGHNISQGVEAFQEGAESTGSLFDTLSLNMSDMHNALAALIPLILVVIGAIPALITGFVAVAGAALAAAVALGSFAALGLVGAAMGRAGGERPSMENITEIMNEILDELFDAFAPAAEAIAPMFEAGLDRLGSFLATLGEAAMMFQTLGDEAGGFADFLEEFLAGAIRNTVRMTEAFAPLFGMLGDFLNNFSLLEELTVLMGEMLPTFMVFLGVVMDMLPVIVRMSVGFMQVLNAILLVANAFFQLLEALGIEQEMGFVIAAMLTLLSVAAVLSFVIGNNVAGAFWFAVGAIKAEIVALYGSVAAKLAAAQAAGVAATAISILAAAVRALLIATGIGALIVGLGFVANQFMNMASSADAATKSMRDFNRMSSKFSGGTNPFSAPTTEGGFFSRGGRSVTINNNVEGSADETDLATAGNRTLWVEKTTGGER